MTIQGKQITLVNLYGPNEDNAQFYENLIRKMADFENEHVIIYGDWNFVLDFDKDTNSYLHTNIPRARQTVLNFIEENNFIDAWRVLNENERKFTWRRLHPIKEQSRLDYFIVSDPIFQNGLDADIIPGYRTDHSGIILKLKLQDNDRGRGYWKFNNSLLKDRHYITIVKDTTEEVKDTYKINEHDQNGQNNENQDIMICINDQLFLETLLMIIRGNTIKYSSIKKESAMRNKTS